MYIITISKIRGHEFKNKWREAFGGFGGRKVKRDIIIFSKINKNQ